MPNLIYLTLYFEINKETIQLRAWYVRKCRSDYLNKKDMFSMKKYFI